MSQINPKVMRSLVWLIVGLLVVGVFGGAAAQDTQPAVEVEMVDTSAYAAEPPYTFCFSNASVSNSWRVSMVEHLRWAVEENSDLIGELIETDANDDPNKQISDTEDLLTQGCDILIISPATADALTPVAQTAMDQGIPVVTVDRNVSDASAYVSYVVADNCTVGRLQAEWLVETLNGEGEIVLMSGIAGASPAEERLQCARAVFAEYPGIVEIAQEYTNWSPVEGKQVMENWLLIFDQIDGVWSDSGLQASGAVEAFVEAGVDVPPITGEDFNRFLKQMNELGFPGVVVPFSVQQGSVAVETALSILAGEEVPKMVFVENVIITADNLADYVRPDLPDDYWAGSLPEVAARLFPVDPAATPSS
jgi:ribose transport system substrate-binding protein